MRGWLTKRVSGGALRGWRRGYRLCTVSRAAGGDLPSTAFLSLVTVAVRGWPSAVEILRSQVWPRTKRLTVDVLVRQQARSGFLARGPDTQTIVCRLRYYLTALDVRLTYEGMQRTRKQKTVASGSVQIVK